MSESFVTYFLDQNNVDTLSGHGTTVRRIPCTSGPDIVEKVANPYGAFGSRPEMWLEMQKRSKQITDELLSRKNSEYVVPKIFISNNKVREVFVPGPRLCDLHCSDQANIKKGNFNLSMAHFLNDMSELRGIKTNQNCNCLPNMNFKNADHFATEIEKLKNCIGSQELDLIADTYCQLLNMPDNKTFVFSHNDLSTENIIISGNKTAIIDFELAGYRSKFDIMYGFKTTAQKAIWDIVNKLPRTKNPTLSWNFDTNVYKLFCSLQDTVQEMNYFIKNYDKNRLPSLQSTVENSCSCMNFLLKNLSKKNRNISHLPAVIKQKTR